MKIVTWNVNSLAVRLPRVVEFLGLHEPDIVCLQETKCEAAAFPLEELAAAGYRGVEHSAGRWAGVAILARDDRSLTGGPSGLAGELRTEEARWVEATVDGLRPLGRSSPSSRRCRRVSPSSGRPESRSS
jgi:exodeoxyribonuclease-3